MFKAKVNQGKKGKKSHNTTPSLPMKTLALLGTTRVMAVCGGTACGARVELGKKRGYVTNRRDCQGWERCGSTNYCWGYTGNRNDNGRVVVMCMGNTDDQKGVIGTVGGRNCDRRVRHLRSWHLNVLVSGIGNYGGRGRKVRSMTSLNEKWLEAVDDVGSDEFSENVVAAVLKVLKGLFQAKIVAHVVR